MKYICESGIAGLIDEATGYQYDRKIDALHQLFKDYISDDLMKFSGIFPQKYYSQIFRLYNWNYDLNSSARPSYVGTFTNTYIYEMLPPHILTKLKNKTVTKASKNWNKNIKQLPIIMDLLNQESKK